MRSPTRHPAVRSEGGFTVVEVAVVTPLVMVIIIGIFAVIIGLLQSTASERIGAQNLYDAHNALGTVEQDAVLTKSFLPEISAGLTDPNAPGGGWSFAGTGENSRVLIMQAYATTTNPLSNNRAPVFINANGCDASTLYYNSVLAYNVVYFIKDTTLYRRRLITVPSNVCAQPYQKQSCPNGSGCAAADEAIVTGVSALKIDYYPSSASDAKIDTYSASASPSSVLSANAARITLTLTRRAYGQPLSTTSSIRISKAITVQSEN